MIEEVLEEQSKIDLKSWAKQYVNKVRAMGPDYKDAELKKEPTQRSSVIVITNVGDRFRRDKLVNALKLQEPFEYKQQSKTAGSIKIKGHDKPVKIRFMKGSGKGIENFSERFEGNIINALNPKDAPQLTGKKIVSNAEYPGIQNVAAAVVAGSDIPSTGQAGWFKPPNGTIAEAYKFVIENGNRVERSPAANPTPKTDIASKNNKEIKISVKQDGAQLLSGQSKEVQCIIGVVSKELGLDEKYKAALIEAAEQMGMKKLIDSLSAEGRGDLGRKLANIIFEDDQFKRLFLLEAMTGNNRFDEDVSKANKLLVWDENSNSKYTDLESWVNENYGDVKYGIRSRGSGRGLGARLETATKEFSSEKKLTKENVNNDAAKAAEQFVQKFNLSGEQLQQLLLLIKNKLQESSAEGLAIPQQGRLKDPLELTQDMIDGVAEMIRKHGKPFLDSLKQKVQDLAKKASALADAGKFTDAEKAKIINNAFENLAEPKILSILDLTGVEVTPIFQFSVD